MTNHVTPGSQGKGAQGASGGRCRDVVMKSRVPSERNVSLGSDGGDDDCDILALACLRLQSLAGGVAGVENHFSVNGTSDGVARDFLN